MPRVKPVVKPGKPEKVQSSEVAVLYLVTGSHSGWYFARRVASWHVWGPFRSPDEATKRARAIGFGNVTERSR